MIIEWTGEGRELPRYGIKTIGDKFEAEDSMAQDLIRQGLVVELTTEIKTIANSDTVEA